MRIAFAGFHIESVSFLTQEATYGMFDASAARAADIFARYCGTNTVPGGVIKAGAAAGLDLMPIVYAYQGAVGPASDEAVERYCAEICAALEAVRGDLAGVILHLHGAAVSPSHTDVEFLFIENIRRVIGDLPLVVAFDYHGNISPASVALLDAAVAYKTSPHVDMGQTGERAVGWMSRLLAGPDRVSMAIAKPPLILPSVFSATNLDPLASIMAEAARIEDEAPGALDISVMAGFSYADTKDTGFSVIVVGETGQSEVDAIAEGLAETIWSERRALSAPAPVYSLADAVDYAAIKAKYARAPIVLLEHADRMNDSTHLLKALIDKGVKKVAVPFIWDEAAVRAAISAGAGQETVLHIGAWSSARAGKRLQVRCKVIETGLKTYRISGPMLTGQAVDLGDTALIDIDGIIVSLVSRFAFAVDEDAFTIFGLNPRDFGVIVLRSKTHFRAVYENIAEEIIIVDTPDWGTSNLNDLPYSKLDRTAVYPLNALAKASVLPGGKQ